MTDIVTVMQMMKLVCFEYSTRFTAPTEDVEQDLKDILQEFETSEC